MLSAYRNARDSTSQATVTPSQIIEEIQRESYREDITAIRFLASAGDADKAAERKRQLPAVTWGGRFDRRAIDGIVEYSRMVVIDLDNLDGEQQAVEVRDALKGHAMAAFVSPSGCGVKAAFRHDIERPGDHASAWHAAVAKVKEIIPDIDDSQIDKSGKDVCRLCFMSSDPGAWIDEGAPILHAPIVEDTRDMEVSSDADGKVRVNRHQWLIVTSGRLVRELGTSLSRDALVEIMHGEWRRRVVGRDPQPGEIENAIDSALAKGYATAPSAESVAHGEMVLASIMSRSIDTVEEDDPTDLAAIRSEAYDSPMPAHLLEVPGLLGRLCAEINRRSVRRQPVLTLGGAIAMCGALFGRKIEGPTGAWTNMACMGIGPSTGGKSTSGNVLVQILTACPHGRYVLGPSDMTSEAALMDSMVTRPSLYWFADEFGEFLASGRSAASNPGKHSLRNAILPLIGSNWARETWSKSYAQGKFNKEVHAPCLSVWGVTVADNLWSNMDTLTATGGFLGRFLLFKPDSMKKPPINTPHRGAFDPSLIEEVDWWCQGGGQSLVNLSAMPTPREVGITSEASEILAEFAQRADAEESALSHRYAVLWGRAHENAHKLALIHAASADRATTAIGAEAARWGVALSEWSVRSMMAAAMREVSSNDSERRVQAVLGWIRDRAGRDGWCSKSALADRARSLPGRLQELGQILDLLVAGHRVEVEERATGGRPSHRFRVRWVGAA